MNYTFKEHLHNYAVWTSARAVQRSFTNTDNIKTAIEVADLKKLIGDRQTYTSQEFDEYHKSKANIIIECLKDIAYKIEDKITYGRAAKIIAIYIKTAIILPTCGRSNISQIAHPPIDSILLKNAHKANRKLRLQSIKWTQLNEKKYFEVVEQLRTFDYENFWELERFWQPTK